MFDPVISLVIRSVTSSRASASGLSRCATPGCPTRRVSGLEAVPVNLSARQAAEAGFLTSGTYGPPGIGSSLSAVLKSSLASKSRARTGSVGSILYRLTWKERDTPSQQKIAAVRASAHRTSDNGSGSERCGWPTPNGTDPRQGYQKRRGDTKGTQKSLETVVIDGLDPVRGCPSMAGWNTARATDGSNGGPNQANGALPADVALSGWPTPMAGTPAQNGNNEAGNNDSSRKTVALAGWATPNATFQDGCPDKHLERKRKAGVSRNPVITDLSMQVRALAGPARLTTRGEILIGSTAGTISGGQLNPEHSRWLMACPAAWASAMPGYSDWLKWQAVMQQASSVPSDTESSPCAVTAMPLSNPSRGNS